MGIYLVVEILANNNNGIYLIVEILANKNERYCVYIYIYIYIYCFFISFLSAGVAASREFIFRTCF